MPLAPRSLPCQLRAAPSEKVRSEVRGLVRAGSGWLQLVWLLYFSAVQQGRALCSPAVPTVKDALTFTPDSPSTEPP